MELVDSRRLPGPNLLWPRPGAVIDVAVEPASSSALVKAWQRQARCILDAVGWSGQETTVRTFAGGLNLAISAPIDALYAATEVNEWAFESACAALASEPLEDSAEAGERLRRVISQECNPRLLALRNAAREQGVAFLSDDDHASVGMGSGSVTWPVDGLPAARDVDWAESHDVPTALITGTNGKTTTVRLLAAIAEAAGKTPGLSSTDQVRVGAKVLEEGDWSGPGGARLVLRDTGVEVALLETARGGMLRRGLAVERADVAAVLNVGADHLGEWGVGSVEALCQGKFVVTSVAPRVVLNADDEVVAARGRGLDREVIWFSLRPKTPWLQAHLDAGGRAFVLDGNHLLRCEGDATEQIHSVESVPITLSGTALYNVANALAAAAVADALDLGMEAIRSGLAAFCRDDSDNPGRLNRFNLSGVNVIVDFAHNPHGMKALLQTAAALPARRRLVLMGQAGDRDDAAIADLARITWDARPDHIILKDLTDHLRGREAGEVVELLAEALAAAGAPEGTWTSARNEPDGVDQALEWAQEGDLLLLLAHDGPQWVLDRVAQLEACGWSPGEDLPKRAQK